MHSSLRLWSVGSVVAAQVGHIQSFSHPGPHSGGAGTQFRDAPVTKWTQTNPHCARPCSLHRICFGRAFISNKYR